MTMTYETVAFYSQIVSLFLFILIFLGVVAYAFWPGNKETFERAARLPLAKDPDASDAGRSA
jgi:cytochrome c oxidase cbb3-type subunit 4